MSGNTFGTSFCLTTFGESHGAAIGGIIDGCPSGLVVDMDYIQQEMDRRRPGQSKLASQRGEPDKVEFLSGIFEGKTTGAPIGFIIRNEDHRSQDYHHLKNIFRPSHGDYTWYRKYGLWDHRGGGRLSARETAARVVGGAIAKLMLRPLHTVIYAYTSQVGNIKTSRSYKELNLEKIYTSPVRCPDEMVSDVMEEKILETRKEGDTIGGIITGVIQHVPAGLGEPVFDKLQSQLAAAMMSIPAAKGFDYGMGFEGVTMKGSEVNDLFYIDRMDEAEIAKGRGGDRAKNSLLLGTYTNNSGGIQGGISNGEDIYFRIAFKPVSTIMKRQKTINFSGEEVEYEGKGRHDPCVLPRAVAVVEAMAALVMADAMLINRSSTLFNHS